jgi:hypothetical protein
MKKKALIDMGLVAAITAVKMHRLVYGLFSEASRLSP